MATSRRQHRAFAATALVLAVCLSGAPAMAQQPRVPVAPVAPPAIQTPPAPLAAPAPAMPKPSPMPQVTFDELVSATPQRPGMNGWAVGLGALGGVITTNAMTGALLPSVTTAAGTSLESALAASRVYAVGGAVLGAFVGQWLYDRFGH